MNDYRGKQSAHSSHLEALRTRHVALSRRIEEEQLRPAASNSLIRKLKAEKLKLKDQIEGKSAAS